MCRFSFYCCVFFILLACKKDTKIVDKEIDIPVEEKIKEVIPEKMNFHSLFENKPEYVSSGFDFPIGKPNANGYYNAQKFQENDHLGDDWNGVGGGDSDLGDNIYAISNGYVSTSENINGGWGNVIQIIHKYKGNLYESVYAHCDTMLVKKGVFVNKGDIIGKIGNANGLYKAHLHLEIRDSINMDIGPGYSSNTKGYLDPTLFIKNNRE